VFYFLFFIFFGGGSLNPTHQRPFFLPSFFSFLSRDCLHLVPSLRGPFVPAPRSFVRDAAIVHAHAATRFLAMRVFCEGSAAPVRWATSIPAIWRHVCSSPKAVR
jgi:hypothetical protein